MSERRRWREWMGVRAGEGRSVSLMLAHSFFTGISTVFFETAASALFLSHYDASLLPFVYLAAAGVSILAGLGYTRVKENVPFAPLMIATLGSLLLMVALVRLGLGIVQASWLVFAMMVAYRLLSILTDLEYWAVAARLYDVQQSKRLFGVIGSGEVTARIAGAFSVPLLVGALGVENLVWLSVFGLTVCLALLVLLLRSFPDLASPPSAETRAPSSERREAMRSMGSSSYLKTVFALALLAVLGKYLVDFAFLSQMQTQLREVESLASFFGLFSGVTQAANLAFRVLVSGRLLGRFGIRVGLLVLPAAHLACTLGILAATTIPAPLAVFWLVIANQGLYKTLKHPVDNPSFKILYQPLPRRERLAAQIGVEVVVTPIAIALAAGLMLAFQAASPASPRAFAGLMAATFAAWCFAAVLAFREYGGALVRALKRRTLDGASFTLEDEASIALVREKLKSDYPGDVIFALDLLERIAHPSLESQWSALLKHPSADVRRYVLLQIERERPASVASAISRCIAEDDSLRVRAAALRALAALGDPDGVVPGFLRHSDARLERGALIGLLRGAENRGRRLASERMSELVRSGRARDRALAARVLGETDWGGPAELLALLEDERDEVRRSAIESAGHRGDDGAPAWLVDALAEPKYRGEAVQAILHAGERADPALAEALLDGTRPPADRARVARVAGRRKTFTRPEALWRAYAAGTATLRRDALAALSALGYRPGEGESPRLLDAVGEEIEEAAWKLAVLQAVEDEATFSPLAQALREEVDESRERVFFLLSFLYDAKTVFSARDNLASRSRERRAYAAEILEVTLSQDLKDSALPLLDGATPAESYRRLARRYPQPRRDARAWVEAILKSSQPRLRDWTRACAIYGAGRLGTNGLLKPLCLHRSDPSPVIAETAAWASRQVLEPVPAAATNGAVARRVSRENAMLTIEKVILLKGVPMFSVTSEEILADVATRLEEVVLEPGELVFSKGDPGDSMYIVASGKVRVFDGDKTINFIGEREIFGELALLDPEPRSASVEAAEESRLFRLDRDTLFDLMTDNVGVVSGIMQVLCRRLRRMTTIATEAER